MRELIRKLVEAYGPSGVEEQIRAIIRTEVEPLADELRAYVGGGGSHRDHALHHRVSGVQRRGLDEGHGRDHPVGAPEQPAQELHGLLRVSRLPEHLPVDHRLEGHAAHLRIGGSRRRQLSLDLEQPLGSNGA